MKTKQETIFLTDDQPDILVSRIAKRCLNFGYHMSPNEKGAMADLLRDIGVSTDDLIDVSNFADQYAINAEIVHGNKEAERYSRSVLRDALFT